VSFEPNPRPDDETDVPKARLQEAIDAAAHACAGDASLDVERTLRTELASRGIDTIDDAWISGVVENLRQGREVEVGEHDGSVEGGEGLGG
jgi:hypothetical protein